MHISPLCVTNLYSLKLATPSSQLYLPTYQPTKYRRMATSKGYSKLSTDSLSLDEMDKSCDAPGESGVSSRLSAEGSAANSNWLKISKRVTVPNNTKCNVIVIMIGVLVLTVSITWLVCERQQDHDRISRQQDQISRQNNQISQLYDQMSQLHDQLQIVSARQCNCNYTSTSVMDGYESENKDNQLHNNSASISSLWLALESESQNCKNDLIKLTKNLSKLTDRVVVNEKRSHENMSHFENTFLEQVSNLTSLQENLHSDFSEVERKASVLSQNIATTNRDLRTQGERIAAVDSRVSTLDSHVTSVHSTLSSKITTESQALQTQGERIAAIESKVSDLGSDITSVRSTLSSKIDNKASDLGTRIDDHISEVNDKLNEQSWLDRLLSG